MIKQWITGIAGLLCGGLLVLMITNVGTIQAQSDSCELINNQEQMIVYFAPIVADSQIKDILPKDTPYTMIQDSGSEGFFRIEYEDGIQGWIDFHTRILNGRCADFGIMERPLQALTDFPTVCFYQTTEELIGYNDADLRQQHGGYGVRPAGSYAVVSIGDKAIGLMGSSAMSGGFVEANRGTFWGHCSGTIQLATALDNARVWTQPDAVAGEIITTLENGAQVRILGDPIVGNIQEDISGDWYEVSIGFIIGWVWSDRLEFGRTYTTPQPVLASATALDGARVWTQSDVKTGQIVTTLMVGSNVNIIGEAMTGSIQFDNELQGTWYPIQQGGTTGWVYEDRLDFDR